MNTQKVRKTPPKYKAENKKQKNTHYQRYKKRVPGNNTRYLITGTSFQMTNIRYLVHGE